MATTTVSSHAQVLDQIDSIILQVNTLAEQITSINEQLFYNKDLDDMEIAKGHLTLAYCMENLFIFALSMERELQKTHPIYADLRRVQTFFDNLKAVQADQVKELGRINVDAAKRFIKRALGGGKATVAKSE